MIDIYNKKYRDWAKGIDYMYKLYEWDMCIKIEEIQYYHFRIYLYGNIIFDFFPMSGKICDMYTKKWGNIYEDIKTKNLPLYYALSTVITKNYTGHKEMLYKKFIKNG